MQRHEANREREHHKWEATRDAYRVDRNVKGLAVTKYQTCFYEAVNKEQNEFLNM